MKVLFVRHGEPDYSLIDIRKLNSIEKNFCPLKTDSFDKINQIAKNNILKKSKIMLASPFTRALQTAAIINVHLGLRLYVEYDLHEWIDDLRGEHVKKAEFDRRRQEFFDMNGEYSENNKKPWEKQCDLKKRVFNAIVKYREYSPVVVVCHGMVIGSQTGYYNDTDFAQIVEHEYAL